MFNIFYITIPIAIIIFCCAISMMTFICYNLCKNKKVYQKLRENYPDCSIFFTNFGVQIIKPGENRVSAPYYQMDVLVRNNYKIPESSGVQMQNNNVVNQQMMINPNQPLMSSNMNDSIIQQQQMIIQQQQMMLEQQQQPNMIQQQPQTQFVQVQPVDQYQQNYQPSTQPPIF